MKLLVNFVKDLWATPVFRNLFWNVVVAILFVAFRIWYTTSNAYSMLLWNLFLALIPYGVSQWLQLRPALASNKTLFVFFFAVWLAFVPNTFYLATDMYHLGEVSGISLWYDLIMLILFAWIGIYVGFVSMLQMESLTICYWGQFWKRAFMPIMIVLNAIGIYLGRVLRFNSWDVIHEPMQLVGALVDLFNHPLQHKSAWVLIAGFSVFIGLVYKSIRTSSVFQK